jgi:hypothetical protein
MRGRNAFSRSGGEAVVNYHFRALRRSKSSGLAPLAAAFRNVAAATRYVRLTRLQRS